MEGRQVVAVVLLVGAVGLVVAAPVAAFTASGPQAQTNNTTSMGTQMSAFMQSSAASANSSVDSGLWQASVDSASEANESVDRRLKTLERRLQRLQNRSDRLKAMRDELPEQAYTARASAIRARIDAVRSAIEDVNETAGQYGVNTTKLDRLRSQAANMTGPEVAALARNITDVNRGPPEEVPGDGGPPGDAGPPDSAPTGSDTGSSEGTTDTDATETDTASPTDRRTAAGNGN